MKPPPWETARTALRDAVETFASAAARVPAERWSTEPEPGKWSPAQIAEHLSLTYEHLLAELRGGPPMRLKGTRFFRLVVRLKVLPAFLREGRVPRGVRAPREVRPVEAPGDRADGIHRFRSLAETFDAEITARRAAGRCRVTHPYFGRLNADQSIRFVEVHIRHHTKQL